MSTDASTDASTHASTHASTDVGVYAHLWSFSVFSGFFWCYFKRAFLSKIAYPSCIFYYGIVCVENLASQQQKSENQKILYSPVGEKKTTEFVFPQKESFGKRAN